MSDGDPRTGTFHQTRITVGNTTCYINGVLYVIREVFLLYTCYKNIKYCIGVQWPKIL